MTTTHLTANVTPKRIAKVGVLNAQLQETIVHQRQEIEHLETQVAWFKRQLFGEKSEKRDMTDNPYQQTIADLLKQLPEAPEKPEDDKQTITFQRGKAKKNGLEGTPDDSGLRFDESVPVKEITLTAPELEGPDADDYEVVSYKTTYRLAQRPGSQIVLKYTRPVVKKKSTQALITIRTIWVREQYSRILETIAL